MARLPPELPYTPIDEIGRGGHKTAFTVDGHPELVLVRHDGFGPDGPMAEDGVFDARAERACLNRIRKLGLPAAQILEVGTKRFDDVLYAAHVMPRYVCSDRDNDGAILLEVLNEETLAQAQEMIRQFKKLQPLHIQDLQFLFCEDGSFVIADPIYVEPIELTNEIAELHQLCRGAKYAMAVRAGEFAHDPDKYFWHAANDWAVLKGIDC